MRVNRTNARSRGDLNAAFEAAKDSAPSISVILPVYRPPLWMLRAAVESVRAQTTSAWELCIVDDGGDSDDVLLYLEDLAGRDPRVRLSSHDSNRGISEATNTAAAEASGEVLVFLDQDDLLDAECLAELALYYASHPEADLVYTDHDKIDVEGRRSAPEFKPGWSPALLLSYMYLGHAMSVRRSLFQGVGGMRKPFDGAQDFDFALRATERARHVGHIPRVLYHWRAIEGSTAMSGDAKPESFHAGAEAVREAFLRRGIKAVVERPPWAVSHSIGVFRPQFAAPEGGISILMATPGNPVTLMRRLAALRGEFQTEFDLLVGDDGAAGDELAAAAASMPGFRLRTVAVPPGAGLSQRLNILAEATEARRIVLLGHDVEPADSGWLVRLNGYLDLPSVRIIGGRRIVGGSVDQAGFILGAPGNPEPTAAFAGARVGEGGYMQLALVTRDCRAASADILMLSTEDFLAVGGLDVAHFSDHLAFADLCIRVAPDGGCVVCPDVAVTAQLPALSPPERLAAYKAAQRWPVDDPFYNRNLSRQGRLFRPFPVAPQRRSPTPVRTTFVSHNLRNEGAPRTLADLVQALAERGRITADVAGMADGPLGQVLMDAGVPVTHLYDSAANAPASVEHQVERLTRHFTETGTEVVFANTLRAFPAVLAAARLGLPSVMWQHESEAWDTYFSDLEPNLRDATYRALQRTYRWTYVAEATRGAWAAVADHHNTMTIPHALPTALPPLEPEVRQVSRSALGVAPDEVMILLPGTVCRRKGQRDAVRALKRLDRAAAAIVKLFIVGAQPEADYLQRLTADIGKLAPELASRVVVTGPVPQMAPYYAAADVSLCTSRVESAPRVILEAMSASLPIISTPVFGISEMVWPGWNAIFYTPGKVDRLTDAIGTLVGDPALRAEMGRRGREVLASRPGFRAGVDAYEKILLEACMAST